MNVTKHPADCSCTQTQLGYYEWGTTMIPTKYSSHMTPQELLDLAIEALKRSGFSIENGHPEDLASAIIPAMEAVAVGYSEGYRRARHDV